MYLIIRGVSYFSDYGDDEETKMISNSFLRVVLECIYAWNI